MININAFNNSNSVSQQRSQALYPNIFDVYANHDETHSRQLSFLKLCQKIEAKKRRVSKKEQEEFFCYFSQYIQ